MAQKKTDIVRSHIIRMTNVYPWPESIFKDVSVEDLMKYRQNAYKEIGKVDWSQIDKKYTHLVFYSELRDTNDNIYYANIYLNGAKEFCTEEYFESHYQNPRQFTIAVHRP